MALARQPQFVGPLGNFPANQIVALTLPDMLIGKLGAFDERPPRFRQRREGGLQALLAEFEFRFFGLKRGRHGRDGLLPLVPSARKPLDLGFYVCEFSPPSRQTLG